MSDILCVTNRLLCKENFLERIEKIAECSPRGIILREKDLTENEYRALAEKVTEICRKHDVPCILHSFVKTAMELHADAIHLPLPILLKMTEKEKLCFKIIGASCHSAEDAAEAEMLGCSYVTAGHIFGTDCKRGVPPRGTDFLQNVCDSVDIPVYAIGGISAENIKKVLDSGADGACIMSGLMTCENVENYMKKIKKAGEI